MIKISKEVLETYIAQQERNLEPYVRSVVDEVKRENPELIRKLTATAEFFADKMLDMRYDSEISNDDFCADAKCNAMMYALSVYHCIKAQLEINELENNG